MALFHLTQIWEVPKVEHHVLGLGIFQLHAWGSLCQIPFFKYV